MASANPDGLERVAQDIGFLASGTAAPYRLLPDYTIPFLGETALSTVMAGVVGVLLVAALAVGLGRLVKRPTSTHPTQQAKSS
jgi:cobalt/nickel transport system permease protein